MADWLDMGVLRSDPEPEYEVRFGDRTGARCRILNAHMQRATSMVVVMFDDGSKGEYRRCDLHLVRPNS